MTTFHKSENKDEYIYESNIHTDNNNSSLSRSLLISFLVISFIPLCALSFFTFHNSSNYLKENAYKHLIELTTLNQRLIEGWFHSRQLDIITYSKSSSNSKFLSSLIQSYKSSGEPINTYVGSYAWEQIISDYQEDLLSLNAQYKYIEDIYLIDKKGNILFTVSRKADLGKNLYTGLLSNTKFKESVEYSFTSGEPSFSDIERYISSKNKLTGFLSAPILNDNGDKIGIISIQLKLDNLFELIKTPNQSNQYVNQYLVGKDGFLRTPLNGKNDDILRLRVNQKKLEPIDELGSDVTFFKHTNLNNETFISQYHELKILNVTWILVSEAYLSGVLSSVYEQGYISIAFIILTIISVFFISLFISRRITAPLSVLADMSMQVAAGEINQKIDTRSNNEIGRLARAFEHMLQMRTMHELSLEQATIKSKRAIKNLENQKFALDQHSIVAVTDIKGTILYVNEKFCDISGYEKEELINKNHRMLKSGLHDNDFFRNLYLTISKGNVWKGEICNKNKSGVIYWVDSTIVPLINDDGKLENYIAIRTDITQRKINEQALLDAKEKAESAVSSKSEFLACMSHEIRTPMNGILGMLGLLVNSNLNEEQLHRTNVARASAKSLLAIINDILDFSKIEAGKLELEILNFDLIKMLNEFCEPFKLLAQNKNIELILDVNKIKQAMIKGDPGRLRQILNNLVGNAIKFTDSGEIVIRVAQEDAGKTNWNLFISVSDTGTGISPDKTDHLFDEFSQVDASTTRKYGGTGLGLAIVSKLCTLMNGNITVESTLGLGSSFNVKVLIYKSDETLPSLPQIDITKLKLLVVDDNHTNCEVLSRQLEQWGASVTVANNAKQAIEICETLHSDHNMTFHIAFLDMQMPNMNGEDLGKILQADERFKKIKLIMMTSMNFKGDAKLFADIGFSAYFPKPATTSDLFNALNIVAEGGNPLKKATPLVTRHYIKSLNSTNHDHLVFENNLKQKWPSDTRILLVEDNQINQEVAMGLLEGMNVIVSIAFDGLEALECLKASSDNKYRLILMDCQMPRMDGYETTKSIRSGIAGDIYKDIPIVAMTANAMVGDKEKCLNSGMSDYLSKPIDYEPLLAKLDKWLLQHPDIDRCNKNDSDTTQDNINNAPIANKVSANDELPIWDQEAALNRVKGKTERLISYIEMYIKDCGSSLQDAEDALNREDIQGIINLAHTIKGMSGNLGGLRLQAASASLEASAREGDMAKVRALIPAFKNEILKLEETMKQYCSRSDVL